MANTNRIQALFQDKSFMVGSLSITLYFLLFTIMSLILLMVFASPYDKAQLMILIRPLALFWLLGYLYRFHVKNNRGEQNV